MQKYIGRRYWLLGIIALALILGANGEAMEIRGEIMGLQGPRGYVFWPHEEVKIRLLITLKPSGRLQAPVVDYEVVEYPDKVVIAQGTTPFNQTAIVGGWAEVVPELPPRETIRWYQVIATLKDGDQVIPLGPGDEPAAKVSFGVIPENPISFVPSVRPEPEVDPSRKVMAFYYTWYGNPEVSKSWIHWPEGGHNPAQSDNSGLPDLGATNHPVLGPYDSYDPRIIKQHLAWAEAAGIDVLIATWWGQGDFTDRVLPILLDAAAETSVRISFYYERIPGDRPQGALDDFRYILENYGDHPGVFRYNDAPVIFVYGRAMGQISYAQWRQVIREIKSEHAVNLIADSMDERWAEIFDGLHMYNPVGQVVGGKDMPRLFDALVLAAKNHEKISSVTIIPGYDDSNIGRATPIIAERRSGELYNDLWEAAIQSSPDWILITSFNEWHEGSEIEPSVENGDFYLEQTARWAERFRQAPKETFRITNSSLPVIGVPGEEYPLQIEINVPEAYKGESVSLKWDVPELWTVSPASLRAGGKTEKGEEIWNIFSSLVVSEQTKPGTYPLVAQLTLEGYTNELSTDVVVVPSKEAAPAEGAVVWTDLGKANKDYGLSQREHADGRTEGIEIDGVDARKTVRGVSDHKYIYFDIDDAFLFNIRERTIQIGVEYLDSGTGSFRVQYDSHNPAGDLNGAYMGAPSVRLYNSGQWRQAVVTLTDARLANRQNGATDFRIAAGTGDLVVRRVWVRILE